MGIILNEDLLFKAVGLVVFLFCGGVLVKYVLRKIGQKKLLKPYVTSLLGRLLTIFMVILGSLLIMQTLGLDVAPLIAFGGIGAAALGFAAKDVISNFFGGFMLHIAHPFICGECIELPERHLEGYVEEIGWYFTSVRNKEKRLVFLPNAIFSQQQVINISRMTHRRILETIALSHSDFDRMPLVLEKIRTVVSAHPAIDNTLPVLVNFHAISPYALQIYLDVYTRAKEFSDYLAIKEEILLAIGKQVAEGGATIAIPSWGIVS